jgi:type VI secretion system secreted protein VgrG
VPKFDARSSVREFSCGEGDLVANTLIQVEGNTMGLGVGDLVKLRKPLALGGEFNPFWDDADFDKEYLITSAICAISINQYETGDVAKSDEPFKATYTLLDSQSRFRPARTKRKPRIEGPQTAIVVGPSADEIYTDKFGRVKVQFDWDRLGKRDEKSSIWIRVSQVWAGKQWGAMHIPRIGHEVIVAFLDGDPDRPIITGRVYNADNMPPYALPDNKTQSGIKSRSSKDGSASNFNEIRFEDLKGKEELHIQAEKDMSTLVKHNQSNDINANQTDTIGADRTTTIHGKDTLTVDKDRIVHIKGDLTTTVEGGGDGDFKSTHTVTGKHHLHASTEIHIDAPTKITLNCGDSSIIMTPTSIAINAGGKAFVFVDDDVLAKGADGGSILVDATVFAEGNGKANLLVSDVVSGASPGDAATLLLSGGDALVKGTTATLDGGGTVVANAGGVTATGTAVKLNA